MKLASIFFLISSLFLIATAQAQYKVSGKVTAVQTNKALENVGIFDVEKHFALTFLSL